ncbi:hypothetical protein H4219_002853 [Mycoemilia scoparia]|uniref:Uncharacterized protein n=1 Tax=Mycoemilia scoparia TaxID=417184 RepID=A0A9W7ZWF6_9FUNG|nr:hypothetical protein H4219_002853 [Mycoemilia scoparia]
MPEDSTQPQSGDVEMSGIHQDIPPLQTKTTIISTAFDDLRIGNSSSSAAAAATTTTIGYNSGAGNSGPNMSANYTGQAESAVAISKCSVDEFGAYSSMFGIKASKDNSIQYIPMSLLDALENLKLQFGQITIGLFTNWRELGLFLNFFTVCNQLSAWYRFIKYYSFKNRDIMNGQTASSPPVEFIDNFLNINIVHFPISDALYRLTADPVCSAFLNRIHTRFIDWILESNSSNAALTKIAPTSFVVIPPIQANNVTIKCSRNYMQSALKYHQIVAQTKLLSQNGGNDNSGSRSYCSLEEIESMFGDNPYSLSEIIFYYSMGCDMDGYSRDLISLLDISTILIRLQPTLFECIKAIKSDLFNDDEDGENNVGSENGSNENPGLNNHQNSNEPSEHEANVPSSSTLEKPVSLGTFAYCISDNEDINNSCYQYHKHHTGAVIKAGIAQQSENLFGLSVPCSQIEEYSNNSYFHHFSVEDQAKNSLGRFVIDEQDENNVVEFSEAIRGTLPSIEGDGKVNTGLSVFACNKMDIENPESHPDIAGSIENTYHLAGQAVALSLSKKSTDHLDENDNNERLIRHMIGELFSSVPYNEEQLAKSGLNLDIKFIQRRLAIKKFLRYFFNGVIVLTFAELHNLVVQKENNQLNFANPNENPLAILLRNLSVYTKDQFGNTLDHDFVELLNQTFVQAMNKDLQPDFFLEFFRSTFAYLIETKFKNLKLSNSPSHSYCSDNHLFQHLVDYNRVKLNETQLQFIQLCQNSHQVESGYCIKNFLGCELNIDKLVQYFDFSKLY